MTAVGLPATVCPKCASPYAVDLEGGVRFCPECRHEWDPTQPQTPADVLGPPPGVETPAAQAVDFSDDLVADAYLETLIGSRVILEGGQGATLLGFIDEDQATVRLDDGRDEIVALSNIERSVDAPRPETLADIDMDQDTAELVGDAALTFACLMIEAGIASVEGEGEDAHLIESPAGWLPDDPGVLPLFEQASAVAVASLIITYGIDRTMLAVALDKIRPTTREGDNEGNVQ